MVIVFSEWSQFSNGAFFVHVKFRSARTIDQIPTRFRQYLHSLLPTKMITSTGSSTACCFHDVVFVVMIDCRQRYPKIRVAAFGITAKNNSFPQSVELAKDITFSLSLLLKFLLPIRIRHSLLKLMQFLISISNLKNIESGGRAHLL